MECIRLDCIAVDSIALSCQDWVALYRVGLHRSGLDIVGFRSIALARRAWDMDLIAACCIACDLQCVGLHWFAVDWIGLHCLAKGLQWTNVSHWIA